MNIEFLPALALFAFVSSVTPGPNNLMLMASGANYGFARSVPHMLGIAIGFTLMIVLVGAGLVQLFDAWPLSYTILKVLSVAYMTWLAWKIARAAPAAKAQATGTPLTFVQAAAFQWVNPKAWAMALTALSVYATNASLTAFALVALVFGLVNLPSIALWTVMGQQMARFLTNPDLELLDTFAFIRPDKAESLQGLYMVQPWDPDRIPVLMVHGVWSSPMTWMEMFNELQSDPVLRDHYQFWFYMYPTGEPLTFALADLRDDLDELQRRCDPHQRNKKLDQMVLVGHSMGGLLSYLMTVDSDDTLWNSVSQIPAGDLEADAGTKDEIQRVFFFESDPSVDRIVTIASPFRGSRLSNRFTQWLGRTIVSLPTTTLNVTKLITGLNSRQNWANVFAPSTSLDSLAERSAVLNLVGHTTAHDSVVHHNIVGVSRGKSLKWWTDGVVTYRSAHRDDADSEIAISASHSQVHRDPKAIDEVRRVLKEHLKHVQRGHRVIPVSHSPM